MVTDSTPGGGLNVDINQQENSVKKLLNWTIKMLPSKNLRSSSHMTKTFGFSKYGSVTIIVTTRDRLPEQEKVLKGTPYHRENGRTHANRDGSDRYGRRTEGGNIGQLLPQWRERIHLKSFSGLKSATGHALVVEVTVILHISIGNLRVWAWFGVVRELAVTIMLETSYINLFVRGIFSQELRIVPFHSRPVAIMADQMPKYDLTEELFVNVIPDNWGDDYLIDGILRVAKQRTVSTMNQAPGSVEDKRCDIMLINSHPNISRWRTDLMATGVMDVVPG